MTAASARVCRFLLEALEDLDSSLKKLNSRLFVVKGQPTDVFPRLLKVLAARGWPGSWPRFPPHPLPPLPAGVERDQIDL